MAICFVLPGLISPTVMKMNRSVVEELDSVVAVRESRVVRVSDGGELGVGEAEGSVGHGERRDLMFVTEISESLGLKMVR